MKNVSKPASFLESGSYLYELIGSKDNPPAFIEYDRLTQQYKVVNEVIHHETTFIPPQNDLVENGTLKLATYPSEYRTELELFDSIRHFINKYVDVPTQYLTIASLYVMLSWVYDNFSVIPYLRLKGEFGTGKSRFLTVAGSLCYKAVFAGGASSVSPIFRIIQLYQGVSLIFDEADFTFSGPESEMIKILNCGYMRGMPVLRTEGDGNNRQPASFNVYGPKILATRKSFADKALESRCLTQVMAARPRADVPRHLPKSFDDEALEIRNKLLLFRLRTYGEIEVDLSLEDVRLDARVNQIALPLLCILKDESVREHVYQHLAELQDNLNEQKKDQEPALIVSAAIDLVRDRKELTYANIAKAINEMEGLSALDNLMISTTKVGRINKEVLGLAKRAINGTYQFTPTKDNLLRLQSLGNQYHILTEDVDLVDLYFTLPKSGTQDVFLEEVQKALL